MKEMVDRFDREIKRGNWIVHTFYSDLRPALVLRQTPTGIRVVTLRLKKIYDSGGWRWGYRPREYYLYNSSRCLVVPIDIIPGDIVYALYSHYPLLEDA